MMASTTSNTATPSPPPMQMPTTTMKTSRMMQNRRGSITQRRSSITTSAAAVTTRRNRRASITMAMRRSSIATSSTSLERGRGGEGTNDNMIGLVECEEVRALALKLAPEELKAFADGSTCSSSHHHDDDNEQIDYSYEDYYGEEMYGEMESLERGNGLLRIELEQQTTAALGFDEMYGSFTDPQPQQGEDEEEEEYPYYCKSADHHDTSAAMAVEITEEVDSDDDPQQSSSSGRDAPTLTENGKKLASTSKKLATKRMVGPSTATPEDRRWFPIDSTPLLLLGNDDSSQHEHQGIIVKEYCMSITDQACRHLFAGLISEKQQQGEQERLSLSSAPTSHNPSNQVPVRTLTIRIRPDVTVNSVMDACVKALDGLKHADNTANSSSPRSSAQSMIIRNGDHISAYITMRNVSTSNGGSNKNLCYLMNIQLCTCKTDECERLLLIRVYHDSNSTTTEEDDDNNSAASASTSSSTASVAEDSASTGGDDAAHKLSLRLRKCCKDIKERESIIAESNKNLRQSSTTKQHLAACPSVKAGSVTFPSLNDVDDWPVIQSSDSMVFELWKELEADQVSYNTLSQFRPDGTCLLDEGYCTQIQQICREVMLLELRENSADLEESAVQAELCTANLIALLRPQFVAYGMAPPSHPSPGLPLREYSLNYSSGSAGTSSSTSSTWGKIVDDALQQIQSWTADNSHNKSSPVEMAEQAVQTIVEAFVKQDDEEQLARLACKKRQVRDRLSNMKSHQQAMIRALSESPTKKAGKAADEFAAKSALAAENDALPTKVNKTIRQVPLLKVNIVVGGLPATAHVTANYILFVKPQLLSWKGGAGSNVFLLDIEKVTFHVQQQGEAKSLLKNPLLPPVMIVKDNNGQEVYRFRSSLKVSRLQSFLDIVKLSAAAASKAPAGKQGNERLKDRILRIMLS
jgi:hypothetical protein